ncbi:protein-export chaperone SecB [Marinibaculum pumilum]|uniref:Protein-export protein SecB n=1 Tax=Marinibaculum pumilum TaxID=1766165 RepID=A0ABV7KVE4_9PROT
MSNAAAQDPSAPEAPSISVSGQYVKDFSFENPNAPESLASDAPQPQIEVNVDVQARGFRNNMYEVVLRIHGHCRQAENTAFVVELDYAGLFVLRNFEQGHLEQACLIECPRLLFPFARTIIANTTRDGGFPPLLLDPIDFNQLYQRSRATQAGAGQAAADQGATDQGADES